MDRAFVGDFQQPFTLLGVEQAFDFDFALDLVDLSLLRLAVPTVFCMNLLVA